MLFSTYNLRRVFALALGLAVLSGCASTPKPRGHANVFVTASGQINYLGKPCGPDQLPARLAKDGVGKEQEIRVHLDDIRNTQLRNQIAAGLIQKGYKRVLFVAAPRASSEVVGEPNTHTEAPVGKDVLPVPDPTP